MMIRRILGLAMSAPVTPMSITLFILWGLMLGAAIPTAILPIQFVR